ncbi:venom metalloproteinase antarease-like TtrivMP_A [Rhipicephalus sanguineus]|uniref:venom metalloproteinase antarease-like TtrivMP_A n=1 Tax=Rhipicephalus sanguineus TaxID=34632 RepID=UPI0020C21DFE|nr:venom metalloproteinase antarease-like TtrivMP_A [Rhipicephalus sanguineus]
MVSQENGLQVEGVLGPKLRIRPSLEHARTAEGSIAHILYEAAAETESGSEGAFTQASFILSERQEKQGDATTLVRPEVLIAVDSAFSKQFKNHMEILRYLTISMNSVNIRYRTVTNLRVRLKLCAVEVLTVYEEHFLYQVQSYVASIRSLERLRDYVQQYSYKYHEYDVVYCITG